MSGRNKNKSTVTHVESAQRTTQNSKNTTHVEEKSPVQGLFNASATSDSSPDSGKLTGELDKIKHQLSDLPTRKDFLSLKKSLVGKSELKTVVTDIVKNLLTAFQEQIQNDFSERFSSLKQD